MPSRRIVFAIRPTLTSSIRVELLGSDRRDGADLIVGDTKLIGAIEHGVDVKSR
jgi:hypothetical protein